LGKHFTLTSSDSFKLGAYRADPVGASKGGIVVIQEIFGVNHHIRAVCDKLAGEGYAALAPAVFDRQQPNFESGYTPDEIANARKFVANPDWGAMLKDVQASIDELKKDGPVAIMGFCMGGSISFLSACKLNGLSAAVCYYGGNIAKSADEKPKIPVQMHFGEKDASIPMSDVDIIKQNAVAIARSMSIRTHSTASIATSVAVIRKPPPSSPGSARRRSWPRTSRNKAARLASASVREGGECAEHDGNPVAMGRGCADFCRRAALGP
jgi:carboxymethylenebutenolidase